MPALRISSGFSLRFTPASWICLGLFVTVVCTTLGTAFAQQSAAGKSTSGEPGGLRHARLRWVSNAGVFASVNRNDARAALKVLYGVVAKKRGFLLDSTVDILDSSAELRARLENHTVELVTLGMSDYLEVEHRGLIVPVLTEARSWHGGSLYSYALLIDPTSGLTGIAGLRGKKIMTFSRGTSNTGTAWLDVVLSKEKLGRATSFFASVQSTDKAQSCILPLFFGAVDACVVDEISLALATEMNPQLGRLRVLAKSRPLIELLVCTPVERAFYHKELIDGLLSLHEDPRGRQMLTVFRTDRLVPIQPGDIDSSRELWRDYNRLAGSPQHGAMGSASLAGGNEADRGKAR